MKIVTTMQIQQSAKNIFQNHEKWVLYQDYRRLKLRFDIHKLAEELDMMGYTWDERERAEKRLKRYRKELKQISKEGKE